MITFLSLGRWT